MYASPKCVPEVGTALSYLVLPESCQRPFLTQSFLLFWLASLSFGLSPALSFVLLFLQLENVSLSVWACLAVSWNFLVLHFFLDLPVCLFLDELVLS